MKVVKTSVKKKDARAVLLGKPVYTEDLAPADCLRVKILRSPHANAIVTEINTDRALALPDVEAVYTWKDIDQNGPRFTNAGQAFPEPSAHDRLLIDRHVRFSGDVVAIIAARTEAAAAEAMELIDVEYEVLPAVLDFHEALDNPTVIHPEENWEQLLPVGGDKMRNLVSTGGFGNGDVEAVLEDCDVVVDRTYHTKACQQTPMESFRSFCTIDAFDRLNVVSSTQIVFHARRHVANALNIPKSKVRVIKPRIGGGFGAKQSSVSEIYPAFVTWKTKKPSMLVYTTEEAMTCGSPRHEMEMHVRLGADRDGKIRAIDLHTLSNTGAYSEHGSTTVELSGTKSISLYRDLEAYRFAFDVVYTNRQSSGAYRGFGGTQGTFAVESAVNELADILERDRFTIREKNITREGDVMPSYYGEVNTSCKLDKCLWRVREMIGWDRKFPSKYVGNGKVRGVGLGMSMQSSGISGIDVGEARIKLNDDGFYTVFNGAGEMGQGCDTVLCQIAAEALECPYDQVIVHSGDTDVSPYDAGSYASSTTFVTGKAVEKCALELREKIIKAGAAVLEHDIDDVEFDGQYVRVKTEALPYDEGEKYEAPAVSLTDIVYKVQQCGYDGHILEAACSHTEMTSPPPFVAGAAEVEVDTLTGEIKVIEYDACFDCGTPINPNLAKIQAEGGLMQGIGMALWEDVNYDSTGKPIEKSYMKYRIPTRLDTPKLGIAFADSYEELGPYGAKSIGEVVLNTPLAAIADAVYNATGCRFTELPIRPEDVALKRGVNVKEEE